MLTIMHPPHRKNVFPPVANPIEQGWKFRWIFSLQKILKEETETKQQVKGPKKKTK